MSKDYERVYSNCVEECRRIIETKDAAGIYALSDQLRGLFDLLLRRIESRRDQIGDDIDEYTESVSSEMCLHFIEDFGFFEYTAYLPLIAKFIAVESAVAYSISGVVDVLDPENKPRRIVGAYLAALLYIIQLQII